MPNRRTVLLLVLLACALLVVPGVVILVRTSEPSYGGRSLSQWLEIYYFVAKTPAEQQIAVEAVRKIGTNAVPHLLKWMRYEQGAHPVTETLAEKVPESSYLLHFLYGPERRALTAPIGFEILGPEASAAVSDLAQLMNDPRTGGAPELAIQALVHLGKDALAPLITTLTNRQARRRADIAHQLHYLGTNARPAIPVLITLLDDKDAGVATGVAWSLARIRLEPALVVPALTNALRNPNPQLRGTFVMALARYGQQALPAVPALLGTLHDPNPQVRAVTSNALFKLAPQALTNATH
jgi:hypothetical protein